MTLIIDDDALEPLEEFTLTVIAVPDIFPVAVVENGIATVKITDNDCKFFEDYKEEEWN